LLQISSSEIDMLLYYLFTLRIFSTFVCLYLAFQMARKIPEAGKISSITGITLYLIGNGLFQWGSTNINFFKTWTYSQSLLQLIGYFYFFTMGFFALFVEVDENRNFPENHKNNIGKGKWKRYRWSIIAIIGMAVLLPISVWNLDVFFNYGFMYLVIPFIGANLVFLKRFSNLQILKDHKPANYFIIGFVLSGFANFVPTIGIENESTLIESLQSLSLQSSMVILGTLFLVRGWSIIPPMIELKWYSKLQQLMVIQSQGSLVLFLYKFQNDTNEKTSRDVDGVLTGGAISGIQSLLSEILKTKDGINEIDQGDKTIYFNHSCNATFVLFTDGKAKEFPERLNQFAFEFNRQFENSITNWDGNLTSFSDADKIIKKTFIR
jgi:hypothetical protein